MKYRYEIPQGLTDEIKWFKYFSIRSLIVLIAVGALGIPITMILGRLGITIYVIVFWIFFTITITLMTMIKIPNTNWLNGGGEYIDQYLMKRLIRKRQRCLYIKGYNQLTYELSRKMILKNDEGEKES